MEKTFKDRGIWIKAGHATVEEISCALCDGAIYAGDTYFWLDGGSVCEACLERYARRYFAPQRRRLGGKERCRG